MLHIGAKVVTNTDGITAVASEAAKRNISLQGARAGGKVLLTESRGQAPRRKGPGGGSLKRAQGVIAKKGRKGLTLAFAVQGAKKSYDKMIVLKGRTKAQRVVPAFYDHLIQGGTKPHRLGKGESLGRDATSRRGAITATAQATGGIHPGTRANPYRKRAWAVVKRRAGDVAVSAMAAATQKEIRRNAARVFAKATGAK